MNKIIRIQEDNQRATDLIKEHNIPIDSLAYILDDMEHRELLVSILNKHNITIELTDIFDFLSQGETIELVEHYLENENILKKIREKNETH